MDFHSNPGNLCGMSGQNMVCRPQGASLYSIPHIPEFVFLTACSTLFKSEPESQDEYPDVSEFIRLSVPHVCCCFSGQELSDSFLRRRRPPFCRTACERRMLSESGLAALRLTSPSRGMTALWCSLWLFFLLPLCVAPARLPTAQPTGRIETPQHLFYTQPLPLLRQRWLLASNRMMSSLTQENVCNI